ncbi:MAG TPA: hypothetical protein VK485_11400 [Sphingomicrobium sp.]|nr:hypothetical protein [Sphingomicrobium sp.]
MPTLTLILEGGIFPADQEEAAMSRDGTRIIANARMGISCVFPVACPTRDACRALLGGRT